MIGDSDGKESLAINPVGSLLGLGRSRRRRDGNPFKYSRLENPHPQDQRSLVGGSQDSDTTGCPFTAHVWYMHVYIYTHIYIYAYNYIIINLIFSII